MDTTSIIYQEIFNQNLLLTQAYCELQLVNAEKSTAEILRSFNPKYKGQPVFAFKPGKYCGIPTNYLETVWSVDPWMDDTKSVYKDLFDQQMANKSLIIQFHECQAGFKGRILIAEVDGTMIDGCSEFESEGLIDIFDCPPIDTWFYLTENTDSRLLFCWIPEQFVPMVNVSVMVNPTDCLRWLHKLTT